MSNFIPLTQPGELDILDEIVKRAKGNPNFNYIEFTDAQERTGELFRRLIGPDFESYKDLATFAEIEAIQVAADLVAASENAQIIIEGFSATLLEAPNLLTFGFDDFIIVVAEPTQITEETIVQVRIDEGDWQNTNVTSTAEAGAWLFPNLTTNEPYKIDARLSKTGFQS